MYIEHFGFREHPFGLTSDPRFLYPNPGHQEAYASLVYGITERRGFVVLTGEVGTGKTTLLRRLMGEFEDSVRFAFVYNTTWSFDEILDAICMDFGLAPMPGARQFDKIQALNAFLLKQLAQHKTSTILIDEGQNLSNDVLENLRLLSNLETRSEKLLQIILVGQDELESKLQQPALRQIKDRVGVWSRLDRLKDRYVPPFIAHRLHTAGYEGPDLFSEAAVQRIAAYSQGRPRQINILCDNALLTAYGTYQRQVSAEIVEEVARDLGILNNSKPPEKKSGVIEFSSSPSQSASSTEHEVDRTAPAVLSRKIPVTTPVPEGDAGEAPFSQNWMIRRSPLRFVLPALFVLMILCLVILASSGENQDRVSRLLTSLWSPFKLWVAPARQNIDDRSTSSLPTPLENREEIVAQSRKTIGEEAKPLAWKTPQAPEVQKSEKLQPYRNSLPPPASGALTDEWDNPIGKADSPEQKPQGVSVANKADRGGTMVTVPRGGTISDFVSRHYGENSVLALSLVQEFNPQIGNLDVVSEGEHLWMPPLTRDILMRQQPDKSYRFIASAFRSRKDAERWVHFLLSKGYSVEIVPQRVSNSMQIYRVEIRGLLNVTAADQVQGLIDVQATRYAQRQER